MGHPLSTRDRHTLSTVAKSSMSGVAASALAVITFSPSVEGMVGTSFASGHGSSAGLTGPANPYEHLPPFTPPLTGEELAAVHLQLGLAAAELESARAATDARIEQVRAVSVSELNGATFAPAPQTLTVDTGLILSAGGPPAFDAPPPPLPPRAEQDPATSGLVFNPNHDDPHLEFAAHFFAVESF